jgi:hypothetical protein
MGAAGEPTGRARERLANVVARYPASNPWLLADVILDSGVVVPAAVAAEAQRERDEWRERTRRLADPGHNPFNWREALDEARAALAGEPTPPAIPEQLAAVTRRLEEAEELLRECAEALRKNETTWIALSATLDQPYPDDPRWSPWTRFGERAARAASQAKRSARAFLARESSVGVSSGPDGTDESEAT